MTETLSRDIPLIKDQSAILFVDTQNAAAHRDGLDFKHLSDDEFQEKHGYYFDRLKNTAIPNWQKLQKAFRDKNMEVMYTTVQSLTLDCRERSLDYKISGPEYIIPKGSWDGKVIDEITPDDNEIVLPKGSSSVFMSTNIDYLLRCLNIKQLVIVGLVTDQCVDSAIRDACDLGYLVTQVTDACATHTQERHDASIFNIKGYCRQLTTDVLVEEVKGL